MSQEGHESRVFARQVAAAVTASLFELALSPAHASAVIPNGVAQYQATISGATFEYNSLAGGYQQTAAVTNLPALLLVEPRRAQPRPTSPVVGLFTGSSPVIDNRPGAINFASNTQGFHVNPNFQAPVLAAIDVAGVQADPVAGTLRAVVDSTLARSTTVELFRVSSFIASAPAQINAGGMELQFGPDGRTVTGRFDFGGNDHIEPGNPLFPVKRYIANVSATLSSFVPAQGDVTVPPIADTTAPVADRLSLSRTLFRLGSALPRITRAGVGTTITFNLSEPATATLAFLRARPGRRVGRRCVVPRRGNRSRPRCTRQVTAGTLALPGHAGTNGIGFQGRLSRTRSLAPGAYTLRLTAVDGAGNRARALTRRIRAIR